MNWNRLSVSGPQFFDTFPAVLVQRIVVGDPLAEQQSSNAVRVLNALAAASRARARSDGGPPQLGLAALSLRRPAARLAARPLACAAASCHRMHPSLRAD